MPTCPACNETFDKRAKGGKCPECDTALLLTKDKIKGVNVTKYVLKNPPKEVTNSKPITGRTQDAVQAEDGSWTVTYRGFLPGRDLVCPNCKEGFTAMLSMRGTFPRVCPCGTKTKYVFNLL